MKDFTKNNQISSYGLIINKTNKYILCINNIIMKKNIK